MDHTFYIRQGLTGVHVEASYFSIEGRETLVFFNRNGHRIAAYKKWDEVERLGQQRG